MESLGGYLRRERELRQISLAELAQTTRIPARLLRVLEADEYPDLPAEVFVRGYLRAYCRTLGFEETSVLQRYEAVCSGKQEETTPPVLTSVHGPERGRSFGVALALVVLLILFTLALSIVLRPRHTAAAVELSWAGQVTPPQQLFCARATSAKPTVSSRS